MPCDRPSPSTRISRRTFGLGVGGAIVADVGRATAVGPALAKTVYTFSTFPPHSPFQARRTFYPLMQYLSGRNLGADFRFVTTENYADFEARLFAGDFDFALANPYQTLRAAECGYRIFGKASDDDQFRGLVIVRTDSRIDSPRDLLGKTIAYPAPTAVAATMMVQYFLQTHGLPIRSTHSVFVGTQEASIQSVYNRASQAAGTWPGAWFPYIADHPAAAAELTVKWRTPSLVNNGLVALKSVPDPILQGVADSLFDLSRTTGGGALLKSMSVAGFEPATRKTYAPVRAFIGRYEAMVGTSAPLEARCTAKP